MRHLALALALLGILILSLILLISSPLPVLHPSDLSSLLPNTKVLIFGTVLTERSFEKERRLTLDSGFELRCSCHRAPSLRGKKITAEATVQRYLNQSWLEAHSLSISLESPEQNHDI